MTHYGIFIDENHGGTDADDVLVNFNGYMEAEDCGIYQGRTSRVNVTGKLNEINDEDGKVTGYENKILENLRLRDSNYYGSEEFFKKFKDKEPDDWYEYKANIMRGLIVAGETGIEVAAGTLNVKDAFIYQTHNKTTGTSNTVSNMPSVTGAAIAISQSNKKESITVNIDGYSSVYGMTGLYGKKVFDLDADSMKNVNVNVNNGYFGSTNNNFWSVVQSEEDKALSDVSFDGTAIDFNNYNLKVNMMKDTFVKNKYFFGGLSTDAEAQYVTYLEENPETYVDYKFSLEDIFNYLSDKDYN